MAKIVDEFYEHGLNNDPIDLIYPNDKEKEQLKCAVNTDEFLFYSNNPESVFYKDFADSGKYFCRETVKGNGQIYTWHRNEYEGTITSLILMYNPNDFDIELNFTNIGTTIDANWVSDVYAWRDYLTAANNPVKITLHPYEYANIFSRQIPAHCNFGVISRVSIADKQGNPAAVTFFDLAYVDEAKSGNATEPAQASVTGAKSDPHRGVGAGFYETFTLNLSMSSAEQDKAKVVSFGKDKTTDTSNDGDSFDGKDLIQMTDSSGQIKVKGLAGNYGVQMDVRLNFTNNTGSVGNFKVVMSSSGGAIYPFVSLDGVFAYPGRRINTAKNLMEMIDLGTNDRFRNNRKWKICFGKFLYSINSCIHSTFYYRCYPCLIL